MPTLSYQPRSDRPRRQIVPAIVGIILASPVLVGAVLAFLWSIICFFGGPDPNPEHYGRALTAGAIWLTLAIVWGLLGFLILRSAIRRLRA
jgi:hypothetical protein